mmetsp:Transcript_20928/g.29328  ORF Transcript_20928/g.29328 Transcript_20928/m.29328 type:complete len:317 (+) Transcript_20928:64-1014(+)
MYPRMALHARSLHSLLRNIIPSRIQRKRLFSTKNTTPSSPPPSPLLRPAAAAAVPGVVVLGGTGAIGRAVAARFAKEGAAVAITSRSLARAKAVAAEISSKPCATAAAPIIGVECDVTCSESVKMALVEAKGVMGGEDQAAFTCVVNASGIVKDDLLLRAKAADIHEVLRTNLMGAIFVTQEAGRILMRQQAAGAIIHVGSIVGLDGNIGQIGYAASKAGLGGLVKTAAKELGRRNVRVNEIAAGYIQAFEEGEDMSGGMADESLYEGRREEIAKTCALGRLGTSSDVASLAWFLASPESAYITGQTIRIDGGLRL